MSDLHAKTRRGAISIVWLGDGRRPEFAPTLAALAARTTVTECAGPNDADLPTSEPAPALVIVAQGFAGEFGDVDVVRLRRRFPTAALVRIVASWCEGELRSAPPVHGVKRYVAPQALPLLLADLARLERGERPDWGLPATATDEETLLATITARPKSQVKSESLIIAASDPQVERWLRDLCRHKSPGESAGDCFGANEQSCANESPAVVIWDVPHSAAVAAEELKQLRSDAALKEAQIIALASFPRREQVVRWREAGVVEVLGKPVVEAALLACLEQRLQRIKT